MLDLVLIAKDSLPIFFASYNKQLNDVATAAFISALQSFAKGSLNTDLVSVRLGNLDIRLREYKNLLYVFGIKPTAENAPSDKQLEILIQDFSREWEKQIVDDGTKFIESNIVLTKTFESTLIKFQEDIIKSNASLESNKELESTHPFSDWDLLPKKLQNIIIQLLEPVILGQRIQILDNDPMSELLRGVMCVFRIDKSKIPNISSSDYFTNIELVELPNSDGITIDPQNTEIAGKFQKNKFLQKIVEKEIAKQKSLQGRIGIINSTIDTIASATRIILLVEDKFSIEQGNIQNILQSLGFEEARLVLELIKREKPSYHEKLLELTIHKEWFSSW